MRLQLGLKCEALQIFCGPFIEIDEDDADYR